MRWLVEVSALGKTDAQKYCVEADSWQRALQSARSERGDDGPMSGFSIELLEEGYRAVDPVQRVRFVVRRAPDDMPVTVMTAKDAKGGIAPTAAPTEKSIPPTPSSAGSSPGKTSPPRPGPKVEAASTVPKATIAFGSTAPAASADAKAKEATAAAIPAVGSAIPGLPNVKVLTSREQDPTEASPLTYREYAFAVATGTTEEVAADVLRAQLRLVEARIASAKVGKLVNLAAFDIEFTGKPPRPPLVTLTWKDWKGEPIVTFPKRGGTSAAPRPPSAAPGAASAAAVSVPAAPAVPSFFPATAVPSMSPAAAAATTEVPPGSPATKSAAATTAPVAPSTPRSVAPPASSDGPPLAGSRTPSVKPPPPTSVTAPPAALTQTAPMVGAPAAPQAKPDAPQAKPEAASTPPAAAPAPEPVPPPAAKVAQGFPTPHSQPPPAISEAPARSPSQPPPAGMVKTPSGRFVRGRITGDELITSLFESMHDLHFLRDALDGGQFCLALATEVLPARAALIHFFDVVKREWIIASCRGKDTGRLLNLRAADNDDMLGAAARKRRALVVANATDAQPERYRILGGSRSLIIAPIMQAGRALGAIEIINPLDGMPFTEDEGNAMTYIAEQYAEYLGSRGIVLDRERIQSAAATR